MSRKNSAAQGKAAGTSDRAAYERGLARQVALACDLWLRKRGIRPGSIVTGKEWLASQERTSARESTKGAGLQTSQPPP